MTNIDVRTKIKNARLRHYEVAEALKISQFTFSVWLQKELSKEKKLLIFQAVENLRQQEITGGVL